MYFDLTAVNTGQAQIAQYRAWNTPERRVAPDWRPEQGPWVEREYGSQKRRRNPHATPPRTLVVDDCRHDAP